MSLCMRLLWLLPVLSALLLASAAPRAQAQHNTLDQRIADQPGVRRYALRNGLEVVVVATQADSNPHPDDADIQLWLAVRAGTMDEDDTHRGASGVLERLLYHGLDAYDAESIATLLGSDDEGNPGDAAPSPRGSMVMLDQTLLMGSSPRDDQSRIESLLGLYARVLDPNAWTFDEQHVEQAKLDLIQTLNAMYSPEVRARQHWLPQILGNGPLGMRAGLPDPDGIRALDANALAAYASAYLRPNRATLIVVANAPDARIDEMIAQALSVPDAGARTGVVDLREGLGDAQTSARSVMRLEPDMQGHQAALVWLRARQEPCLSSWSVCAAGDNQARMRSTLVDRVAGELIRHRVERLGVASMGRDTALRVDQVGLAAQVDLIQCVVRRHESDDWESTLRLLLGECDRLARDGAGSEEIVRARGSLLARWHRGADDWRTQSNAERVWLVHWLVTSGRAVQDMVRWDELATRMMSSITEDEINQRVRQLLSPGRVRALVVAQGEASQSEREVAQIDALIHASRRAPLPAIDPDWMRTLGGAILDERQRKGEITQITQHPPSQTWNARLASGIEVWARATGADNDNRVQITATLWGSMFRDASLCEAQIDAAMQAWVTPSSETRSARWLAVYMQENGIELSAHRVVGGVQLRIGADVSQSRAGMELLYLLLDRPMIDAGAFDQWSTRQSPDLHLGVDPLERGLLMLYQPTLSAHDGVQITLDDAQRTLTRIVRNARIGVGIAGRIDPASEIEQAGALLGEIVYRDPQQGTIVAPSQATQTGREQSIVVPADKSEREAIFVGMRAARKDGLDRLRATILAAMVLEDRARALGLAQGIEDTRLDAQVVMSDALGDDWALVMRARGQEPEQGESTLREAMATMVSEGINDEDLAPIKRELDRSIERYFDRAGYWSQRLSTLSMYGRDVHDLWTIREGYAAISAQQASEALREIVHAADRFKVRTEHRDPR